METICRALLAYCLLHYRGDENIKSFIWDLITPSEDGSTKTLTNHSGKATPTQRSSGFRTRPSSVPRVLASRPVHTSPSGEEGQEGEATSAASARPARRLAGQLQPRAHTAGGQLQEAPEAPLQQVGAARCTRSTLSARGRGEGGRTGEAPVCIRLDQGWSSPSSRVFCPSARKGLPPCCGW